MKPLLSILIPAYNAEKYIAGCLESVFSQAEEGIEYVIVDDGCSDGTMSVAAEVSGRFPEASKSLKTVTHESNKGLPASRYDALQAADGEYVLFVDADDSLEPGACSSLMQIVRASEPDMVCFSYVEVVDGIERPPFFKASYSHSLEVRIRESIALRTSPYVWNKVVRRGLFDGTVFPKDGMAEDWVLTVQLMLAAESVVAIPDRLYRYRILSDSMSRGSDSADAIKGRALAEARNIALVENLLKDRGLANEYSKEIEARKSNVKRLLLPLLRFRGNRQLWLGTFREINFRMLFNRRISPALRLKHLAALLGVYPLLSRLGLFS